MAKLAPAVAWYAASEKRTSEVDIRRTLMGDLYLALTQFDDSSQLINLTILVKPLINWIWIGSIISSLGTALVLLCLYTTKPTTSKSEQKGVK